MVAIQITNKDRTRIRVLVRIEKRPSKTTIKANLMNRFPLLAPTLFAWAELVYITLLRGGHIVTDVVTPKCYTTDQHAIRNHP